MAETTIGPIVFGRMCRNMIRKLPEPEAFVFPRWFTDPWTMGGYTYPAIGSPPEDHDDHARPLANRVFFAGEGTEPIEYGTVHAALWSAEMAAEAIFELSTGARPTSDHRPWAGARRGRSPSPADSASSPRPPRSANARQGRCRGEARPRVRLP